LLEPLEVAPVPGEPERVNFLVPELTPGRLGGGYLAVLQVARRLRDRGRRPRLIVTDWFSEPGPGIVRELEAAAGADGLLDGIEIAFGRRPDAGIPINPGDMFVATTWATAHLAHGALEALERSRFLYLVQDVESLLYGAGSQAALADQAHRLPHHALYSSDLLRDHFRNRGQGVFAAGAAEGERRSAVYAHPIGRIPPPDRDRIAARDRSGLLFYARPDNPGAVKNMFELGALALSRLASEGALAGWDLRAIGAREEWQLDLDAGATLEMLPWTDLDSYRALLGEHAVGLALLYTPHPGVVPLEMAAAGLATVTNTCAEKDARAVTAIAGNLIAAEPTLAGLTQALREALTRGEQVERRLEGAELRWPRTWDEALDDQTLSRIEDLLSSS
jgi:hypothetical protein